MDKIDYAGLTDDELRHIVAEATVELDKRRTRAEAPNLIAALYQRITGTGVTRFRVARWLAIPAQREGAGQ